MRPFPPVTPAQQGQWDRIIAKREHARRQFFIGLRTKNNRRFRYWDRAFDRTYKCEECGSTDGHECRYHGHIEGQPPHAMLCWQCAPKSGFCPYCGEFRAGEWDYNFNDDGLCGDCRDELRECSPSGVFANPRAIVVYVPPLMPGTKSENVFTFAGNGGAR